MGLMLMNEPVDRLAHDPRERHIALRGDGGEDSVILGIEADGQPRALLATLPHRRPPEQCAQELQRAAAVCNRVMHIDSHVREYRLIAMV